MPAGSKPGERRGGRQKGTPNKVTANVKAVAGDYTVEALDILVTLMRNPNTPPAARIAAAREVLDRGHGRPAQALTGMDSAPPVAITITHQEIA